MFNMGLTERHLRKFHGQRIFSTVLFENLPQLCIQIWYFIARKDGDLIVVLTFISSIVSIFFALIDVYSSLTLTSAMKLAINENKLQIEGYFFDLVGNSIIDNRASFKIRPNAMRKLFAKLLEVDARSVECNYVFKIENGLQYGFTVFSISDSNTITARSSQRIKRIVDIYSHSIDINSIFVQEIIDTWKLNKLVTNINQLDIHVRNIVTLYDFQIGGTKKLFNNDSRALIQSDFYKVNKNIFTFEKIGLFQTICISNDHDAAMNNVHVDNIIDNKSENNKINSRGTNNAINNELNSVSDVGIIYSGDSGEFEKNYSIGSIGSDDQFDIDVIAIEQTRARASGQRTGQFMQVAMLGMVREQIKQEFENRNKFSVSLNFGRSKPTRQAAQSYVHGAPSLNNGMNKAMVCELAASSPTLNRSVTVPV